MAGTFLVDGYAVTTGASIFSSANSKLSLTCLFQAASGIGKESVINFAEAGAKGVVLADIMKKVPARPPKRTQKAAKDLQFKAIAVKVDITDEASVDDMV